MIIKNEKMKRAILAVLADTELHKILDAIIYIASQLIKLYEKLICPTLLLIER